MIGFEDEIERPGPHIDEGPETANMEKPQLYESVGALNYLPAYGTRGTRRKYLVDVFTGKVFKVTHSELRHFEVDLEASHMKKLGPVHNGLVVRKMNIIQESRGQPKLGFSEYEPPEQVLHCLLSHGCIEWPGTSIERTSPRSTRPPSLQNHR